jgi:hypothetical protein
MERYRRRRGRIGGDAASGYHRNWNDMDRADQICSQETVGKPLVSVQRHSVLQA